MTRPGRQSTTPRLLGSLAIAALSAAIPSCGGEAGDGVPLHPATGQVLHQGKPLPDVLVFFRPAGAGEAGPSPVPIGRTDAEGKFRLSTPGRATGTPAEGAPAGDYLVSVTTPRPSDTVDFLKKAATKSTPDPVRSKYNDPKTSGLKAVIKPGDNTLGPFDLQ